MKNPTTAKVKVVESNSPSCSTKVAKNFITNNSDTEMVAAIKDKKIRTNLNLPRGNKCLKPAIISRQINSIA
jgi:hypothetical protein